MDLDRFLAVNAPVWDRLAYLTGRARRGAGRLSADELAELVQLYQRTSTHLSYVRTYYGDPSLTIRLTGIVASASAIVYGARPRSLRAIGRFFTLTFPAAVWHARWFVLASFVLTFGPAVAAAAWFANSPDVVSLAMPEAERAAFEQRFADYYREKPAAQFSSEVFTNNVQVAFFAFAGGILLCGLTAFVLVYNGLNIGAAAGIFLYANREAVFFGLVLPHGLLELTAVVIAGASGLRLGWTLIDPGDRPRAVALAEEGRRAVVIVLGLILAFFVAGLIEGFVTGSTLPTYARVGLGVVVELTFVIYLVVFGRDAAARGLTGALGETDTAGWARSR